MSARYKNTQFSFRINTDLLQQAQRRCQEEGVSLSHVIMLALQDFVRNGIRPQEPDSEEDPPGTF